MNKNQKIALIAGAAVLAIIVFIIPVTTNYSKYKKGIGTSLRYCYPYQVRSALIWGGAVAVFTFVAFIILKSKD